MLDSVIHLGNYLMMNLSVDLDIQTMDFINQANTVLLRFKLGDSVLKTHFIQSYRLSFYGGSLWCLSSSQIKALEVSYNNILHRIWSLPCVSHTAFVHFVAELKSVYNLLYHRLYRLKFFVWFRS